MADHTQADQTQADRVVRIGGASGFWGDSSLGAPQLVSSGQIDYLVFDYLAELTMSILAGARLKKPELGYATDFVAVAMKAVLRDVVDRGIRVVSNAGGVNPQGCAAALAALAAEQGVPLKIAVVMGDDVLPLLPQLPTVAEAGVAGYENSTWTGIGAPARTPADILARLNREFVTVLALPEVQERFTASGAAVVGGSVDEFRAFLHSEHEKFGRLLRKAGGFAQG
jgi:hypothetical protein